MSKRRTCSDTAVAALPPLVILVPIAADSLFAVLRVVLGKGRRSQRIVVPAGGGLLRPVVGRQGKALIEPFAEADDDFFPRPPQADDANIRLGGNGYFEVGKVERGDVAEDSAAIRFGESGQTVRLDDPFAVGDPPGQEGRLFVRRL